MNPQTMQLTPEQKAVTHSRPANIVVYAAPGSGKTSVLSRHIAHQLVESPLSPSQIMAVTFTKQAAVDLKRRLLNHGVLTPRQVESIHAGTFHAQVFRCLLAQTPDIPLLLGHHEQLELLKTALQSVGVKTNDPLAWISVITQAKSTWPETSPKDRTARKVLASYERLKLKANRWDFDDILLEFSRRLAEQPNETLYTLRDLRYLLVDEFQDTNSVQWNIVRTMAANLSVPVFVVGDDDQSIYGFRGASPKFLLNFPESMPNALTYTLSTNFRSDYAICEHAQSLIRHNRVRQVKPFSMHSKDPGEVVVFAERTEAQEAHHVAAEVMQSRRIHPNATIAILSRTRRQLLPCMPLLQARDVEFRTFHDAKGKEYDEVHIVGAVEHNPYLRNSALNASMESIEEERRLFYVAMTRAKHQLSIHFPVRCTTGHLAPSSFIQEACIPYH